MASGKQIWPSARIRAGATASVAYDLRAACEWRGGAFGEPETAAAIAMLWEKWAGIQIGSPSRESDLPFRNFKRLPPPSVSVICARGV